jgi:hypothetical protein
VYFTGCLKACRRLEVHADRRQYWSLLYDRSGPGLSYAEYYENEGVGLSQSRCKSAPCIGPDRAAHCAWWNFSNCRKQEARRRDNIAVRLGLNQFEAVTRLPLMTPLRAQRPCSGRVLQRWSASRWLAGPGGSMLGAAVFAFIRGSRRVPPGLGTSFTKEAIREFYRAEAAESRCTPTPILQILPLVPNYMRP